MLHIVSQLNKQTLDHCVSTCAVDDEVVFIAEAAHGLLHSNREQTRQEPCLEQLNLLTAKNVTLYGISTDENIIDTVTEDKKQLNNTTGTPATLIQRINYGTFVQLVAQANTVTSWY